MFREFFLEGRVRSVAWAWSGLVLIAGHAVLRAWIKYRLNEWYGDFYDLGGSASEVSSGDSAGLEEGRIGVFRLLLVFSLLCLPGILVHPVFKLLTNRWVLSWRVQLIKVYIANWRLDESRIENGAQRVHEDTQRFARGIQTCCVVVLDSVLTLVVFAPLLIDIGKEVKPYDLPDVWLFASNFAIAVFGVVVSVFLGWSLVHLEIENQRVEANLRKKLVLLEEDPGAICGRVDAFVPPSLSNTPVDAYAFVDLGSGGPQSATAVCTSPPIPQFKRVVDDLKTNYTKLYNQFAVFSLWLGTYEQCVTILPYLIAAPLLFCEDPARRITLGKVTQLSNAFAQVFVALNVLSDNWVDVTDFCSVVRRLREWEQHLNMTPPPSKRSLICAAATSSTEMAASHS